MSVQDQPEKVLADLVVAAVEQMIRGWYASKNSAHLNMPEVLAGVTNAKRLIDSLERQVAEFECGIQVSAIFNSKNDALSAISGPMMGAEMSLRNVLVEVKRKFPNFRNVKADHLLDRYETACQKRDELKNMREEIWRRVKALETFEQLQHVVEAISDQMTLLIEEMTELHAAMQVSTESIRQEIKHRTS